MVEPLSFARWPDSHRMGFFGTLLWPVRWVVELVLVACHGLLQAFGLDPNAGGTWLLAIFGLLIIVRLAVLPLTLRAVRNGHHMARLAPKLRELQAQYAGRKDADSTALTQKTIELYRESNVNPLGSILPLLVQTPIFIGLYLVLRTAQNGQAGIGLLGSALARSFGNSTLLGAPLHLTIFAEPASLAVGLSALVLVGVLQFITQFITYRFNTLREAHQQQTAALQRIPLVLVPVVLMVTSLAIQLGLVLYLLLSSVWTLVQQLFIIRYLPMPGSPAGLARERRRAKS